MKTKRVFVLSLLFVASALFEGCDKGVIAPSNAVRLVSKMDLFMNNEYGGEVNLSSKIEFRYDVQDRITTMIHTNENGITTNNNISYSNDNTMVVGASTYMLNGDGFVTSRSDNGQLKETRSYNNGYLQEMVLFSEMATIPIVSTYSYFWENGNIKSEVIEISFLTDPVSKISVTSIYEYNKSLRNKPCSMDFGIHYVGTPYGWYGKSTLNLPSKIVHKREDGTEDITTIRYETDTDSYPVKIFVRENNSKEALRTIIKYDD